MIPFSRVVLPLAALALVRPVVATAHVMPAAEASITVSATVLSSCVVDAAAGGVRMRCNGVVPGPVVSGSATALPLPTADERRLGIVDAVSITY